MDVGHAPVSAGGKDSSENAPLTGSSPPTAPKATTKAGASAPPETTSSTTSSMSTQSGFASGLYTATIGEGMHMGGAFIPAGAFVIAFGLLGFLIGGWPVACFFLVVGLAFIGIRVSASTSGGSTSRGRLTGGTATRRGGQRGGGGGGSGNARRFMSLKDLPKPAVRS